jgi:hypothetical protein
VLIVGEVVSAQVSEDFQEYWTYKSYSPLLYKGLNRGVGTMS